MVQKIVVMGPGNMLGLEDIARISAHSYSARCVSSTGVLMQIDVEKFHNVIKHIPNGFAEITRINKIKWKSFFDKITILEEQKNQMGRFEKDLILKEGDNFTQMDFFKATFFEVKLDKNKMNRIFEQKERTAADLHILQ